MIDHVPFMKQVHPKEGPKKLALYFDSESDALSNQSDLSSAPLTDGSKAFFFGAYFEAEEGMSNHMEQVLGSDVNKRIMDLAAEGAKPFAFLNTKTINLTDKLPKDPVGLFSVCWMMVFPKNLVAEVLKFFTDIHKKWINDTHFKEPFVGEKQLFYYRVGSCPMLADPANPALGPDPEGKVGVVMTEIYKSSAGLDQHGQVAMKDGIMPQIMAFLEKGGSITSFAGPIKHAV